MDRNNSPARPANPRLVLADPETLFTLPEREFQGGMAEVIKYGVIGDVDLFTQLERAEDLSSVTAVGPALLMELLCRSAAAKAAVVAADERESGRRAIRWWLAWAGTKKCAMAACVSWCPAPWVTWKFVRTSARNGWGRL